MVYLGKGQRRKGKGQKDQGERQKDIGEMQLGMRNGGMKNDKAGLVED